MANNGRKTLGKTQNYEIIMMETISKMPIHMQWHFESIFGRSTAELLPLSASAQSIQRGRMNIDGDKWIVDQSNGAFCFCLFTVISFYEAYN